jgi:phosphatidate cytidylyltransferase
VIGPLFVYVTYLGGTVFAVVMVVTFLRALYEWVRMTRKIQIYLSPKVGLLLAGVLYGGLSFAAFIVLRLDYSLWTMALFLVLIWSSDIGGYAFGKTFGGAKPLPKISPNKTLSGFAGAFLTPAVLSAIWAGYQGGSLSSIAVAFGIGFVVGVAGQAGDLIVSAVKRASGMKDTGRLIPGHGGLLDRIDSMMMASPVFLGLIMVFGYA